MSMKTMLSGFLSALTLLGSVGFSNSNAQGLPGDQNIPQNKRRKVEIDQEESLTTSDKISIGFLGAGTLALIITAGVIIFKPPGNESSSNDKRQQPSNGMSKKIKGGLPNVGNSCYINSLIQVLYRNTVFSSAIKEFNYEFLNAESESDKATKGAIEALRVIFGFMDNNTAVENHAEIKSLLSKCLQHTGRQDDPSRVFSMLDPLLGQFLYSTFDAKKGLSLSDCLNDPYADFNTDSDQFLVRLNRVDGNGEKIEECVEAPECMSYNGSDFRLTSVIIHSGPFAIGGHYYSYCMAKNGQWYKYDDAQVTEVDFAKVQGDVCRNGTNFIYTKSDKCSECLLDAPSLII